MNSTNVMKQIKTVIRLCKICGAPARFLNFGVLSCASCKMFFKRYAKLGQEYFICESDEHCEINLDSRRVCPFCRLKKCFAMGMKVQLIRSPRKKHPTEAESNKQISQITACGNHQSSQLLPTLNLLRNDRSNLSIHQWILLSNLINCYDEHGGLLMARHFMFEQSVVPLKLRYKPIPVKEFVTSNIMRVQRIFEKNLDYLSLSLHDRSILLRHTVKHTGCFGGIFILYQSTLFDDPIFYKALELMSGSDVISTVKNIINTYDLDMIFMKLILTIIAFSTTSYTIYSDTPPISFIDVKTIVHIQDTYIELTWKYLVYRYGYEQAIKRFCNLLRCLFYVNFTIVEGDRVQGYSHTIENVVKQTEKLFITKK